MYDLLAQLTGISDNKPFECVGTRDEVNVAINMSISNHLNQNKPIPYLYQKYMESPYYDYYKNKSVDWDSFQEENLVPPSMQKKLKDWLERRKAQ